MSTFVKYSGSVVPIVASYRKLVAVAENRRQSIEIFHYRLLERRFRQRNASQRFNLGDPISDENTACFLRIWLSISEINLPRTVERTSENKNGFLAKDAAIILTGSVQFSAMCCCKCVSKNLFSGTRLPVKKKKKKTECAKMEQNESHFLI